MPRVDVRKMDGMEKSGGECLAFRGIERTVRAETTRLKSHGRQADPAGRGR
jgi:hypothetical protein